MINEGYVKRYCCEDLSLIENYKDAIIDTTQTWECHHKAEILPCGRYEAKDLIKFGLYYNRPASELIFLTRSIHNSLHNVSRPQNKKGFKHSDDFKNKHRDICLGKHWYNDGISETFQYDCPEGFVKGRLNNAFKQKKVNL